MTKINQIHQGHAVTDSCKKKGQVYKEDNRIKEESQVEYVVKIVEKERRIRLTNYVMISAVRSTVTHTVLIRILLD